MPSVVWFDGFDHYASAGITTKWNMLWQQSIAPIISLTAGRKNYGLLLEWGANVHKSIPDTGTVTSGFAFRFTELQNKRIVAFRDEGVVQVYLALLDSGRLAIVRGDGTILGLSSTVLTALKFYYIEFNATISNSTGVIQLRIGGASELNLTLQDTQMSSNARVNMVSFGEMTINTSGAMHIDDVVITNGALLGPQKIDVIRPNGGVPGYMQMEVVGGAGSHYQAINEITPDSDTSHLYSQSAWRGSVVFSEYENIAEATGGAIPAIAVHTFTRKEYGNTRGFSNALFPGTVDGASGSLQYYNDPLYIETDYAYHSDIYETNPGTGGTWSVGSINALKAGFKRYL